MAEKTKVKLSAFAKKKARNKRISICTSIIMWTISLFLFTFCLSNLYQRFINKDSYVGFFGIGNAIVVSESMYPALEVNDFVVYKSVSYSDLQIGDIVLYPKSYGEGTDDILIIHRLESMADGYAVTRGDNNSLSDEPFEANKIVGKMVFSIPKLGYVLNAFSTYYALAFFVVLMGMGYMIRLIVYWANKKQTLAKIATDKENRKAVQVFFDM